MIIYLKEGTDDDMPLILAWRNNPLLYKYTYTQGYLGGGVISWETHYKWWNEHRDWGRYIIKVCDNMDYRSVGYIQFADWGDGLADIGIYIGEITLWGKGVGKQSLHLGLDKLKVKGFIKTRADILPFNKRSQKMFLSLGFTRVENRREGEWSYERIL